MSPSDTGRRPPSRCDPACQLLLRCAVLLEECGVAVVDVDLEPAPVGAGSPVASGVVAQGSAWSVDRATRTSSATRPQTIGYSLADSPVGLAAWIYAMFQDVSDSGGDAESVFTLDEMLDDITLYWLTNTGASSARLYWEAMSPGADEGPSGALQMPTGISMFPKEQVRLSRRWAESRFSDLIHFDELDAGGHFAALEQPAVFVEQLRACFTGLRP